MMFSVCFASRDFLIEARILVICAFWEIISNKHFHRIRDISASFLGVLRKDAVPYNAHRIRDVSTSFLGVLRKDAVPYKSSQSHNANIFSS
ncbi:MAG TPA: hypothetical protein PLQ28_04465, partial [Flexilinea sp.]|nr:hypothetical protein [Flexilinea sp.]